MRRRSSCLKVRLMLWQDRVAGVAYLAAMGVVLACAFTRVLIAYASAHVLALFFGMSMNGRWPGFPRAWELLGFVFSKKVRERTYEPARQELLVDYLERRRYRMKWARRWLTFAFTLRTLVLVADCVRASTMGRIIDWFVRTFLRRG